jgi:histidinol-phosphate aminotransferase
MDISTLFRRDFSKLDPYAPVKPLEVLAEEIGVPIAQLVKLDANENLYGPIPEVCSGLVLVHTMRDCALAVIGREGSL